MKRVLVTRPSSQAAGFADKLTSAGFEPIFFPVIQIRPIHDNPALEKALLKLGCYDWVVFTSVNAVDMLFKDYASLLRQPGLSVKFAAIGPKTAQALQARGVTPDFVPDEYVAEAILPGLGDLQGRWVLLPRAEIARQALPAAIADAGGIPHEIAVYKTLPVQPDPRGLAALKAGVEWITFTSPSTVQNFVEVLRREKLDPLQLAGDPQIACIGPITERAAREEGFAVNAVAGKYTTDGLVTALSNASPLEAR